MAPCNVRGASSSTCVGCACAWTITEARLLAYPSSDQNVSDTSTLGVGGHTGPSEIDCASLAEGPRVRLPLGRSSIGAPGVLSREAADEADPGTSGSIDDETPASGGRGAFGVSGKACSWALRASPTELTHPSANECGGCTVRDADVSTVAGRPSGADATERSVGCAPCGAWNLRNH